MAELNCPDLVAYFTMEVALDPSLPTYAGGLGVLAGDFLGSAADLGLPLVAVTLCYKSGYFTQILDSAGRQSEEPVSWDRASVLSRIEETVEIEVSGRAVTVGAWELVLEGAGGKAVRVVFLDTDQPANDAEDRAITDQLYSGDAEHRLRQEAVLGIGGVDMLDALGYDSLEKFHMNEGHASLLTLRLLELGAPVAKRCVFTTHTPVPAGHDRFPSELVSRVLGPDRMARLDGLGLLSSGQLNMTELGTSLSGYVNAVSRRHGVVTREMMPKTPVESITNGVHHAGWAAEPMRRLFDETLPGWRLDSSVLRYALDVPLVAVGEAHARSKAALLDLVNERSGTFLDPAALTIGLARRVTPYKRAMLLLTEPDRLLAIAERHGPLQVVCSGKAHPRDEGGKATIAKLKTAGEKLGEAVRVVFLENYDLSLAHALVAGCDIWLNTPQRPLEASGTSGMKAAVNGVPSLSILDGWWLEGCVEGVTGWAIGSDHGRATEEDDPAAESALDAVALYDKLDGAVAPCFFSDPDGFLAVRRSAIALNGSFFSTDRMAREYARAAYGLA